MDEQDWERGSSGTPGYNLARSVLDYYMKIVETTDIESLAEGRSPLQVPVYSVYEMELLCSAAKQIFSEDGVSLPISGHIAIVGDLHGQLLDLLRILHAYGLPTEHQYLFLGDIVDRGDFSTETCTVVLALKVVHPDSVFVIRGNHEFRSLCEHSGFQDELATIYGQVSPRVFESFLAAFSMIPLTAIINKRFLCVHGGLGPNWFSLSQARNMQRPVHEFGDPVLDAMMWSDPDDHVSMFGPSVRGTGFFFGQEALEEFLQTNSLELIIRAHECVNTGCQFMFNDKCITVFSASNYGGVVRNNSAVFEITAESSYVVRRFAPLQYLRRSAAHFGKVVNDQWRTIQMMGIDAGDKLMIPKLPSLRKIRGSASALSLRQGITPIRETPIDAHRQPVRRGPRRI
jgi:protein phosphatase